MPTLKNARHERFAQELAGGKSASEAYAIAGYSPNRRNASVLRQRQDISHRIGELLEARDRMASQASQKAADALGVTKERVMAELAKVAFADISAAVKWGAALALKDSETGEVQIAQGVELIASADLPPNVSAAISEVRKTKEGISIKFHDKLGALEKLGKELGMFIERSEVKHQLTLEQMILASYNRGPQPDPLLIEARLNESEASK
jgi:phage terminase small subunit